MARKIILAFTVFFFILHFISYADTTKMKDLTGDGVEERITKAVISRGASLVWFKLSIEQKTPVGWKNIFPDKYPFKVYDGKNGSMFPNIDITSVDEVIFDKFDKFQGLQVAICQPYSSTNKYREEYMYFKGYFFKKEPKDENFVLYKMDITDVKMQMFGRTRPPSPREKIRNEFKKITKFTKAHNTVKRFWKAVLEGNWDIACSMCKDNYARSCVDGIKKINLSELQGINFNSWNGKYFEYSVMPGCYSFSSSNEHWGFGITVDKDYKITACIGEGN